MVKDTTYHYCEWIYDDLEGNLEIYVAPEEIIEKVSPNEWHKQIQEWTSSRQLTKEIPFIVLNHGYRWNYSVKKEIFVGNQHSGIQLDATYLNKALIVHK